MEIYPKSIRAYATLKLKEPVPKTGLIASDESFSIRVNGQEYDIDFDECEISVDKKDRSIIEIMWKNPDREEFPDVFDALTLDTLKNGDIELDGNLDYTIVVYKSTNDDTATRITI